MIKSKSPKYPASGFATLTSKSLVDVDLSIGNKRTPRQDAKSNTAQDDKQHNAALRWLNHKKQKKKLDMCENHLFRLKEKVKKDVEGVILGQKWYKIIPPQWTKKKKSLES